MAVVGIVELVVVILIVVGVLGAISLLALAVKHGRFRAIALGLLAVPVLLAAGGMLVAIVGPSIDRGTVISGEEVRVDQEPMVRVAPHRYHHSTDYVYVGDPPATPLAPAPLPAVVGEHKSPKRGSAKVKVEDETDSKAERLFLRLQPTDAQGQAAAGSAVDLEIRTEPGTPSQAAGLLRALASALIKAAAETPSAETAASFVAKVVPTSAAPAAEPTPTRPAWVEASPKLVGDVYQVPLAVGPYESRLECDRRLPAALEQAVDEYVRQDLGAEAVGQIRLPRQYLRSHLVSQVWEEQRKVTVTSTEKVPMVLLHVLVAFDADVKILLRETWHRVVIFQRLRTVGLAAAGVLVLLATFWAYLRIDLATRGAYRNRLRLATALVVALLAVFMVTLT
jgi:hypothetical protein